MESGIKDYNVASRKRDFDSQAHAPARRRRAQRRHQGRHAEPRRPGYIDRDGHGDALEHAGREDGAPEDRHRQMGAVIDKAGIAKRD